MDSESTYKSYAGDLTTIYRLYTGIQGHLMLIITFGCLQLFFVNAQKL